MNIQTKNNLEQNETFVQAVAKFNAWDNNAALYYDTADNTFWADCYPGDDSIFQSYVSETIVCVFDKTERQGHLKVAQKRAVYIDRVIELFKEGWSEDQAHYHASSLYA